jgi:hypothetical protein
MTKKLLFPLGGLNKGRGFQDQPPYTTPDCENVRPVGPLERRMRGGSRPGLVKAYPEDLTTPLRMLNSVNWLDLDASSVWTDHFIGPPGGGPMGGVWSLLSGTACVLKYETYSLAVGVSTCQMVRDAFSTIDNTKNYTAKLGIGLAPGLKEGSDYADESWFGIRIGMDDAAPDVDEGLWVRIRVNQADGTHEIVYHIYILGELEQSVSLGVTSWPWLPHELGVEWNPTTKKFSILLDGAYHTKDIDFDNAAHDPPVSFVGDRVGYEVLVGEATGEAMVDYFRVTYESTETEESERTILVASANGAVLSTDDVTNSLSAVTGSGTVLVNASKLIHAAPFLQRLLIGDHGDTRIFETTGKITSTFKLELTADNPDWTALGIDLNSDMCMLSLSTTEAADGLYSIIALEAGFATLSPAPGNTAGCTCRIELAPKAYNAETDTIQIWNASAGKGSVPLGCPCIAVYQGRIVLAGAAYAPHVYYMSRAGAFGDWNYGADPGDVQRAFAGTSEAGSEIGEPIRALIPWEDDYLVIGCTSSIWVMRGSPTYGGTMDRVSDVIGIIDKGAHCSTPGGDIVFLSQRGVYVLPVGGQAAPIPLSEATLPDALRNIGTGAFTVQMVFDDKDYGIHLWLTPPDYVGTQHWWIDWRTKTFWPLSLDEDHEPTAVHRLTATVTDRSAVLLGCRDGYLRKFDRQQVDDDGISFTSYILIGPIAIGDENRFGIVNELVPILAMTSGDVSWSLLAGNTAEEAMEHTARSLGTWTAGFGKSVRPRERCGTFFLKLSATDSIWALERVIARLQSVGRIRLA